MSPHVDCFSSGPIGPQLANSNNTHPQQNVSLLSYPCQLACHRHLTQQRTDKTFSRCLSSLQQEISSFAPRVPQRFDRQHDRQSSPLPSQIGFDLHRNRVRSAAEHHHHQLTIDHSLSSSIASFNPWLHSSNQLGHPPPGASTPLPAFPDGLAGVPALLPSLSDQSSVAHCTFHPLPLRPTGLPPIPPSNTQTINRMSVYSAPAGVIRNSSPSPPDHSSSRLFVSSAGMVAPPNLPVAQASLSTNWPADSGLASLSNPIQNGRAHPLPQATNQSIAPSRMQLPRR